VDELNGHGGVLTRENHLALGQVDRARYVRRAREQLWAVSVHKRRVAATFGLHMDTTKGANSECGSGKNTTKNEKKTRSFFFFFFFGIK
jgi:hypothetical protein